MLKSADKNVERWIRKVSRVLLILAGVSIVLFFGFYLRQAPRYREMHRQIDAGVIVSADFTIFHEQGLLVDDKKELDDLAVVLRSMEMTSLFRPRKSRCMMRLFLRNDQRITYTMFFDFKNRKTIATIAGGPAWEVGGISMGYLEDRDSKFFDWLTQPNRFGSDPEKLRYCSYSDD